jgi:hypothetical protein
LTWSPHRRGIFVVRDRRASDLGRDLRARDGDPVKTAAGWSA